MKILYGIQATGNGHISRAIQLTPYLKKVADVDILISGTESSIHFPYPIKYKYHGMSFYFGKKGNIDYQKTVSHLKPIKLLKDIINCPVKQYDLVISDFEPITAWSSKIKKVPSIGVSHQASFKYPETPRAKKRSPLGEFILRSYAPTNSHIGVHFEPYHPNIFTPIIRDSIRSLITEEHNHYVVYLPAFAPDFSVNFLSKFKNVNWRVFSKHVNKYQQHKNVKIFPTGKDFWLESIRTCKGILMGAGFEGPSEALYLGKKLFVVPMRDQYEQLCNAAALEQLGIPYTTQLDQKAYVKILDWIQQSSPKQILYENNIAEIVHKITGINPSKMSNAIPLRFIDKNRTVVQIKHKLKDAN